LPNLNKVIQKNFLLFKTVIQYINFESNFAVAAFINFFPLHFV